jgi:hypothetical protein
MLAEAKLCGFPPVSLPETYHGLAESQQREGSPDPALAGPPGRQVVAQEAVWISSCVTLCAVCSPLCSPSSLGNTDQCLPRAETSVGLTTAAVRDIANSIVVWAAARKYQSLLDTPTAFLASRDWGRWQLIIWWETNPRLSPCDRKRPQQGLTDPGLDSTFSVQLPPLPSDATLPSVTHNCNVPR